MVSNCAQSIEMLITQIPPAVRYTYYLTWGDDKIGRRLLYWVRIIEEYQPSLDTGRWIGVCEIVRVVIVLEVMVWVSCLVSGVELISVINGLWSTIFGHSEMDWSLLIRVI